jgi:hypothetical protein
MSASFDYYLAFVTWNGSTTTRTDPIDEQPAVHVDVTRDYYTGEFISARVWTGGARRDYTTEAGYRRAVDRLATASGHRIDWDRISPASAARNAATLAAADRNERLRAALYAYRPAPGEFAPEAAERAARIAAAWAQRHLGADGPAGQPRKEGG